MEKIDINDTGVVDGIRNKMEVARSTSKGLMPEGMSSAGDVSNGKWYRIANTGQSVQPSSGLINFGNRFYNDSQKGLLIYMATCPTLEGATIIKITSTKVAPIAKARVVYSKNDSATNYVDVFISLNGTNTLMISGSCLINLTLKAPIEVSETPDAGYYVKEFTF